ncbi:L7Ae/L30e/S12e/Gadd45 family ribosomal protein [Selenomonas sp. F0473]|uniref:L7Ae/L30e/S12e/Gadd45 family ribosomal protein n=1 Tax=Selenomonas sp. F0473 TaxID=999423 RepID=UPI002600DF06|nr:ribosomal L7Ae/L30e/S12e/Gadd45 family protein [Selenomonas sp. F0473]
MSLEKLRSARRIAGVRQVQKAVMNGSAEMVFIASDADERVTHTLLAACAEKGVAVDRTATKDELGQRARLEVGAAAVAVLR